MLSDWDDDFIEVFVFGTEAPLVLLEMSDFVNTKGDLGSGLRMIFDCWSGEECLEPSEVSMSFLLCLDFGEAVEK